MIAMTPSTVFCCEEAKNCARDRGNSRCYRAPGDSRAAPAALGGLRDGGMRGVGQVRENEADALRRLAAHALGDGVRSIAERFDRRLDAPTRLGADIPLPVTTRDTVMFDTSARRATSLIVGCPKDPMVSPRWIGGVRSSSTPSPQRARRATTVY